MPRFVTEARALQLEETNGVRRLVAHQRMQALAERGPEAIERSSDGRAVFLRCEAEYRRQPGTLEARDDGLTFVGVVTLEIPWSTVRHIAKTTYDDSDALAIQEVKRRTATTLVFRRDSDYSREVIVQVWQRLKAQSIP